MISIVIPAKNEAGNLKLLHDQIVEVVKRLVDYEIIFINDGSKDGTQKEIEGLVKQGEGKIKGVQFLSNLGKAAALSSGFKVAKGEVIIQMDADLQDDPQEIPNFLAKIKDGFDLVVGWKVNRKDSFIKNNTSKLFNAATNFLSKAKLHDHNCGFKGYRAEVAKGLKLYGELHRYIPVLVSNMGYKVAEIPVNHRERHAGKTKYGPIRFIHGALDLATVTLITKFRTRPLHLFGYIGICFFILGFGIAGYLTGVKFIGQQSIGERPLLLLSVMLMIMGVQIGITGLMGEQILTTLRGEQVESGVKRLIE